MHCSSRSRGIPVERGGATQQTYREGQLAAQDRGVHVVHADARVREYAEQVAARDAQIRQERAQDAAESQAEMASGEYQDDDSGEFHVIDHDTLDDEAPF